MLAHLFFAALSLVIVSAQSAVEADPQLHLALIKQQLRDVQAVMEAVTDEVATLEETLGITPEVAEAIADEDQEKDESSAEDKAAAVTKLMSNGVVQAQILGHSGKIVFRPVSTETPSWNTNITIIMDNLYEYNANGAKIMWSSHKKENFANTDFTFSNFDAILDGEGQVIADRINFTSNVFSSTVGVIRVSILIFRVNTTINVGTTESFNVTAGTLKFNVQVDNWPFCVATDTNTKSFTYCKSNGVTQNGARIVLGITIKVNDTANAVFSNTGPLAYSLANTVQYQLSEQVFYSATGWTQEPAGFPEVLFSTDSAGNPIATTRIAFDKFTGSAFYDPLVKLNVGGARPTPRPSPTPAPTAGCGSKANGATCKANSDCRSCKCTTSGNKKKCSA